MKFSLLISIISLFIYFTGCSSNTKTSTGSEDSNDTKQLTEYENLVNTVAKESCDCLKPLEDIQNKLEKGEIQMQDYASKMQNLTSSLQSCTEKMTEATQSKDEMRVDVINKMKGLCPKIASVIVPVQ